MSARMLRCPRCGRVSLSDLTYCPQCGEAIDPALVAEMQWLYGALNDLDTRIARGEGEQAITALRDDYRTRYLAIRRAPAPERPAAPASAPAPVAVWPPVVAPSAPPDAAAVAAVTVPIAPAPTSAPRPAGPVFSWQAFLSEQAIAIMMYMGGFLGLVAMLSFEIGGWQSLDLSVKLGAIILVYVAFGALGLVMRRLPRLHTVGGAYLGVFALMTPLLALGIYRFGLQAAGFPGAAMLSLSAGYAAIIYLALAWRTRFATYAYLGWSAMILALLAAVYWADAPREALVFALAVASLLLLLPGIFYRLPLAAVLETPALQLAAVTSIAAAVGTLYIWLLLAIRAIAGTPLTVSVSTLPQLSTAVYALASCTLVLVAMGWSVVARRLTNALETSERAGRLNVLDWLIVAAATHATIAIAALLGADRRAMSIVLAALALAMVGILFMLWRRAHERTELRYLVEALALLLAVGGCLGVVSDPAPNWPYLLALTTGIIVASGLAVFESAPLWLLPAGVFLSLDYHALLDALSHPMLAAISTDDVVRFWMVATTMLVVALVVPWLVAPSPRAQRFAAPVYLVALGNALYVTLYLFGHDPLYATLILGLYTMLALVAGWRLRQPLAGGLVAGFFGFLLPLPFAFSGPTSGFVVAGSAVATMLLALGLRGALGRSVALPPYLIALWSAFISVTRLLVRPNVPNVPTNWSFLGLSISVWLLLAVALLATLAILWDNLPWAMFIPALAGLVAAVATPGLADTQGIVLFVALAATGIALRLLRGHWWWSIAWYIAALLASLIQVVAQGFTLSMDGLSWRIGVGLLFVLIAYIVAAVERQPWITAVVPFYLLGAALFVPGAHAFALTLVMTYSAVVIGLALRLRFGRRWVLAAYLSAIAPSLIAVARATPPQPGVVEALLLIFALTAYGIALIERAPVAGIVAAAYAGLAAVVQPDAHALLPLALALAAIGIAVGRAGGWRWAWPAYAASLVAAMMTALLGLRTPGFEGWALLALALVAYLVALIEAQVEGLALALFIGVLALAAGVNALGWVPWQALLAFVALSWLYIAGQWFWGALPWLRDRRALPWWTDPNALPNSAANRLSVQRLGGVVHHVAGLLVGSGVVVAGLLAADTYSPHTALAQVEVVALVSLAIMVALSARTIPLHALWYVAGGLLAIAVSWEVRWIGADNIQAFVLAPASYLLIIGVLLPADQRLRNPVLPGQLATLLGALLLLLPTLAQSFTTTLSENWIYASVLAVEALVIAAIGVAAHSRALILLGTGFFGLAAIRGALLAFSSGVPVALIIAALALLLMGSATWLSLRVRHETGVPQP